MKEGKSNLTKEFAFALAESESLPSATETDPFVFCTTVKSLISDEEKSFE